MDIYNKQIGDSGKTARELEKTIALLKKVVERVQMENEELKKAPHVAGNEELQSLRQENAGLKVCFIKSLTGKCAIEGVFLQCKC